MFERRRVRKQIANAPDLTADTPDGVLARVTGTVRTLDHVLRSPTTGRSVVAFAIRLHEPSRHEPGGMDSSAPFDYVELVPFVIESEAGKVIVDSQFADIVLPEHRVAKLHDRYWADFCDDRRLSPSSTGVERPLLAGAIVTVLGTTARRPVAPGREAGFRDSPTQLCLVGDFDHPLLIADSDDSPPE